MRGSRYTLPARVLLIVFAICATLAGNMLQAHPQMGAGSSAFAKAVAAETDPVARAILLRGSICNPSGIPHENGLSHRHCDACSAAPAALPAPKVAYLVVEAPRSVPLPVPSAGPAVLHARHARPPGRAPPAIA